MADGAETVEVVPHRGARRGLPRGLPKRPRPCPCGLVRPEERVDALAEVEVEIPRLDVLEHVRDMHVGPAAKVTGPGVVERLDVRYPGGPERGPLGRGEAEEELGRVRDEFRARD